MVMQFLPPATQAFRLEMSDPLPPLHGTLPKFAEFGEEIAKQQESSLKPGSRPNLDGFRGALWLPSYLRRDATALGLLLLSIGDITSSFL